MMVTTKIEKIAAAIRQIDQAQYDALEPSEKQLIKELIIANRAISRFRDSQYAQ